MVLGFVLFSSYANANTIDSIDASFQDGGTLSGWLDYNATNNQIVAWDFTTTAGSLQAGQMYTNTNSTVQSAAYTIWGSSVTNPYSYNFNLNTGALAPYGTYLELGFTGSLAQAGSALITGTTFNWNGSWEGSTANNRIVEANLIPEPNSFALLGMGFLVFSASRRKNLSKVVDFKLATQQFC